MEHMNIVITGGSSGLGKAIIEAIEKNMHGQRTVYNLDKNYSFGDNCEEGFELINYECDVRYFNDVELVAKQIYNNCNILINCAGINSIGFLENFGSEEFSQILETNAKSIYNTSRAFLFALKQSKGTILNIISNASHMPMTGSLAYNASKGAAHIMTLQLARELTKRYGITVFGISPNKLAGTGMSQLIDGAVPILRGWTEEQAKQYQLDNLVTGEETDPKQLAEFISYLLSSKDRHKYLSGCVLPYGA